MTNKSSDKKNPGNQLNISEMIIIIEGFGIGGMGKLNVFAILKKGTIKLNKM